MRLGRWAVLAVGITASACASTIGPIVPSIQVLVVLDSLDDTLRIIPVDTPNVVHKIKFAQLVATFGNHALALKGQLAAIGHGGSVVTVDVVTGAMHCDVQMAPPANPPIASLAFSDNNGDVYAAIPTTNGVPHIDPLGGCGKGEGFLRGGPQAFANARSTLFAVTGDSSAFSWLTTTNLDQSSGSTPLPAADSIPLSLPGHAQGVVLGSDGFLYVINAGTGIPNARLSQVNPVSRTELNVIPGFGTLPKFIATDGADRIFVASAAEGLMVFNIRTNHVERDANSFIPLLGQPRGLAADDVGRVYALIAGSCSNTGSTGMVQVFGADLVNQRPIAVGSCPAAIGVTDIPAVLYHFTP